MNVAEKDALAEALALLSGQGDLRVWSIIVTIFGDMAQNAGDEISGAVISALTERMGIKPAAMRVALHRLRKDGWIESVRDGRISRYHLSDHGRAESASASGKIYGDRDLAGPWQLLVLPPLGHEERMRAERHLIGIDYAPLGSSTYLGRAAPIGLDVEPFAMEVCWRQVPGWLKSSLASHELSDAYDDLRDRLNAVADLLHSNRPASPLEIVTLRALIVHHWRRLVLRHPDLPAAFYPDHWPGETCRTLVSDLLEGLSRPALDALELQVAGSK